MLQFAHSDSSQSLVYILFLFTLEFFFRENLPENSINLLMFVKTKSIFDEFYVIFYNISLKSSKILTLAH